MSNREIQLSLWCWWDAPDLENSAKVLSSSQLIGLVDNNCFGEYRLNMAVVKSIRLKSTTEQTQELHVFKRHAVFHARSD